MRQQHKVTLTFDNDSLTAEVQICKSKDMWEAWNISASSSKQTIVSTKNKITVQHKQSHFHRTWYADRTKVRITCERWSIDIISLDASFSSTYNNKFRIADLTILALECKLGIQNHFGFQHSNIQHKIRQSTSTNHNHSGKKQNISAIEFSS